MFRPDPKANRKGVALGDTSKQIGGLTSGERHLPENRIGCT